MTFGTTHEITLEHGTIRYRELGDGPVLVFVHGALVNGLLWKDVAESLAPTHRCIVPDWPLGSHELPLAPGADRSPLGAARRIADFLEALDLTEVTLVGNDTGGALCQLVVTRHPERIGRLVLTDCDAFEVWPPPAYAYLKWLAASPAAMSLTARLLAAAPVLARLPNAYGWLAATRIDGALLDAWLAPGARDRRIRDDVSGLFRDTTAALTLQAGEELKHFDRPALIAWGTADPFFKPELARRLAAALPQSELKWIDGASVYVALDRPVALAGAISEFVARDEASRAAAPLSAVSGIA